MQRQIENEKSVKKKMCPFLSQELLCECMEDGCAIWNSIDGCCSFNTERRSCRDLQQLTAFMDALSDLGKIIQNINRTTINEREVKIGESEEE